MTKNPPLRRTTDIEIVNRDFDTENRREAAEQILSFYDDGVRTFVEMEERGEWSRSLYQEVYHKHFAVKTEPGARSKDDLAREALTSGDEEMPPPVREAYQDGFQDGIEWALRHRELLERFAVEPTRED